MRQNKYISSDSNNESTFLIISDDLEEFAKYTKMARAHLSEETAGVCV